MFRNLSARDAACLALRVNLGVIFLVHGCDKLSHDWGQSWDPVFGLPTQLALAWGELIGGAAMLAGLLTRVTAVCFGFVMVGALYLVGTSKGFHGTPDLVIRGLDYMRVGAEFPFSLMFQCVAVLFLGGGALSVDHYLRRRFAKGAAAAPGPAAGTPHIDSATAPAETSPR